MLAFAVWGGIRGRERFAAAEMPGLTKRSSRLGAPSATARL